MSCIVVFLIEIVSFLTCTVGKISVLEKIVLRFHSKARIYFKEVGKNENTLKDVSQMYHRVYHRRKIKNFILPVEDFNED